MKIRRCLPFLQTACLFPLLAAAAFAQNLLPPDGFAPGWKAGGKPRTFIEKDLFNHIDGGAELFLEFGFKKLLVQTYASGTAELDFEIYEMTEPDSALGIYLMNAGAETPWPDIPVRNSSEDAQVVAIKGPYYLKINNFAPGANLRPAMVSLIRAALSRIPEGPPGGGLLSALPAAGLVPGSGRLIRGPVGLQPFYTFGEGDILGLNGTTFAVLADYRAENGTTYSRLIATYASAEAADAVLRNFRANHDPYLTVLVGNDPDRITFSDYQKKYGRIGRRGAQLEIIFNATALDWDPAGAPF